MNTAVTTQQGGALLEQVLISGDLSKLNATDRVMYYKQVCESVGLNPLTKPFEYITLNGKLTLYALRACTEQLRQINGVSVQIVEREVVEDCYVVTARATDKTGRTDESIGAVPIKGLTGEARSNALMKCETKAKRRVTLSICGLGLLDETEVGSIPGAAMGVTPTAGYLAAQPAARQEVLQETAQQIKAFFANDQVADAYSLIEDSKFDNEEMIALWSLLPSNIRSAHKRMKEAETAAEKGAISPSAKKRLEATIKDAKLDRDAIKKWMADNLGCQHFQDLTKDQYKELDDYIATLMTTASARASSPASPPPPAAPVADATASYISADKVRAIESEVEQRGIKGRFSAKLAASGIKSPDLIPADKVAAIESWLRGQK